MPHFLDENISILRRWAAVSDEPLPEDWGQFRSQNLVQAADIGAKDPELALLLSGKASAALKADVLAGKFPHVAPDQDAIAREQFNQQIADTRAKVKAGDANLTERIWLEVNDPEAVKPQEQMPSFYGPLVDAQRNLWIRNQEQKLAEAGGQA